MLVGWTVTGLAVTLQWLVPGLGQRAVASAAHALCNDRHVAYSDPQDRLAACLRKATAKLDRELQSHGVRSEELEDLRMNLEGN
jgi:hypothetical protein